MLSELFRIGWRRKRPLGEALLKKDNPSLQHLSTVFCHVEHIGQAGVIRMTELNAETRTK
jgi:hypothetical protein